MTHQLFFGVLHIIGNILWLGGTASVALLAAGLAGSAERAHAAALRRVALGIVTPGVLLAWIGGLGMLVPGWSTMYAKAGWMHGKIGLAVVAAGLTGMLTGQLRKAVQGTGELKPRLLRGIAYGVLAIVVINVTLAIYKP